MQRLEELEVDEGQELDTDLSQHISARLSASARKLRLSTSSRSTIYAAVGLRPRPIDRLFSALSLIFTLVFLITPIVVGSIYFGLIATPQFQAEARFTVRSSTPALGQNQIGAVAGIPSAKIYQDTQIVMNFVQSPEIIDEVEKHADLHAIFGNPSYDWWARLPDDATREDLLDYWEKMVRVEVSPTSGIVTLKVRAFSAQDAASLATEVVKASEVAVNAVNDRIWKDVNATAEANFEKSRQELQAARENLAKARNQTGVLSIAGSSEVISNLLSTTEGDLLALQQRYNSQAGSVSKSAPQLVVLQKQIASKQAQVDDLKRQLAGTKLNQPNLADVSESMSQMELAQTLAEQKFAASLKAFEQVKFVSKQQLLYLDAFTAPRAPDEAEYPKRSIWIGLIVAGSLIVWGSLMGVLYLARARFAH